MLFSPQYTEDHNGIFRGWGGDSRFSWHEWESKLPSLQTMNFFRLDPAYQTDFSLSGKSQSFIQEQGMYSVMTAMRNCIVRISTAWGYFTNTLGAIQTIFKENIETIQSALETAKEVMDAIKIAVDSISWIPIVGWVIKVIFEVVNIIFKIIKKVKTAQQKRDQAALDENARTYALPMADWDPNIDTFMCQYMQRQLSMGMFDLEWCFMPRYPAKNAGDFIAERQKYNPDDECFSGWLIYSNLIKNPNDAGNVPGLGFVPGTMNLHASMSLNTEAGGDVKDLGDFFPITRSLAAQIWSQTVKGSSGMTFAVDTDKVINAWKEYVSSAYHYGLEGIRGWSMVSGGINKSTPLTYAQAKGSIKYKCSSCDYGGGSCHEHKDLGKWRTPPGNGHSSAFLEHLQGMFGWKTYWKGQSLKNEDDWWETMTPVQALRNLEERQEAMVRSRTCMYLDDSTNAAGSGQPRFKAIRKGTHLHKIWQQCVQAMFESGDWMTIDYRDVIPGEDVDKAIRQALANRGTTVEKFFNLNSKSPLDAGRAKLGLAHAKTGGPTVLGDPEPPKPPELVEVRTARPGGMSLSPRRPGQGRGGSSKKSSSAAPLLIGAAAIGLLMMRGRGRS